ncbi:MAG: hypothetical protein ACRCXX_14085 [Cetobacterium sp.]|uniref:hypothetical protein n=1 Tax=Cetobacterium sp. TaxID=2071632 RepID=UPI003F348B98
MIEQAISERNTLMQQNRFQNTSTLGRSFLSSAVAAPLIDSYALNSYSRGTWSKFDFALKNKMYENYTMMGSSVFGGAYEKMLKLTPGSKKIFGGKYTSNFIKGDYSSTTITAEVGENMIEKGFGISRNHTAFFQRLSDAGFDNKVFVKAKNEAGKNYKVFLNKKVGEEVVSNIEEFSKIAGPENTKKAIRGFFNGIKADDIISFQQDAMKSGMKFSNPLTKGASKEALDLARNELSEQVYKQYFTKTATQEIMGSPLAMLMTGAGSVGGKLGTGLNIAGAVLGTLSNVHQESMIQTSMNMDNFTTIRGENILNNRTDAAIYSNNRASMSNEQDLNYVLNSRNIAEHYSREQVEPEIDRTKSRKENFIIY